MTNIYDISEHQARRADRGTLGGQDKLSNDRLPDRRSLAAEINSYDAVLSELADRIVERVVARLGALDFERPEGLVDAREIARTTGRSRAWVYEHAAELGAVRLGSGPRPRLGFSRARVAAYLEASSDRRRPLQVPARAQPRARRRGAGVIATGVELLPIRGHDA